VRLVTTGSKSKLKFEAPDGRLQFYLSGRDVADLLNRHKRVATTWRPKNSDKPYPKLEE
jgi:hypothetical protein